MQLDLSFWGPRTLRGAINDYMAMCSDGLAEGTVIEYRERASWLIRELGESTALDKITYDVLYACVRRNAEVLAQITMRRRFQFLLWVLRFAHGRGLLDRVPMLPKLRNDGKAISRLHTVAEWEVFRRYLPAGPFRKFYDLAFWTLQHGPDLMSMERWMLDPGRVVLDEAGHELARGAYWRRNQKNNNPATKRSRCEPCWVPCQPELARLIPELLEGVPERRDGLIVGKLWNLQRTLNMAQNRAVADGHDIGRITPRDLRRSGASMLVARGYLPEAVRIILGHTGQFRAPGEGEALSRLAGATTVATKHYFHATPQLFAARRKSA